MYEYAVMYVNDNQVVLSKGLVLVHPKLGGLSVKIYIERDLYQPNIVIG